MYLASVQYIPIGYKFLVLDRNGVRQVSSLEGIKDNDTMVKIDYLKNITDDTIMQLQVNARYGYKLFCTIDILRKMGWYKSERE